MSIVCGTDFSESSERAAEVAAGLAAGLKQPMYLVHALASWLGDDSAHAEVGALTATRSALQKEADKLKVCGAEIHPQVELGEPADLLARGAEAQAANLLVFGASGRAASQATGIGSRADRLAQQAQLPVLLVRESEPFQEWFARKRPLRVVVGVAFDRCSDAAWAWAKGLAAVGPIELVGVHFYWPPQEFQRLGLSGVRSYTAEDPEVSRVLQRELKERFPSDGDTQAQWHALPSIGSIADHLRKEASRLEADLLVVGSRSRNVLSRMWEGSISRAVVHRADASVACIPLSHAPHRDAKLPYKVALVATDFTSAGNAAIEHAYTVVGPAGTVDLVHVLHPDRTLSDLEPRDIFQTAESMEDARRLAASRLRKLVPPVELSHDRLTEVHVLESVDVSSAIAQAAERLDVDLICMGVHMHQGLRRGLGSIEEGVVSKTHRPALLVNTR